MKKRSPPKARNPVMVQHLQGHRGAGAHVDKRRRALDDGFEEEECEHHTVFVTGVIRECGECHQVLSGPPLDEKP
jgi:hypothetical protein